MDAGTVARRTSELELGRVPFVHATVVRAERPTSARPGDAAIVLADGSIEGFVGGQCAESSVRAAALDALHGGRSLLLRVLPEGAAEFPETEGARQVVNPCLSGGALEIYLEPRIPAPVLRVSGGTPIADAVAAHAALLGMQVRRDADPDPAGGAAASVVVVAGLGRGEHEALRAGLASGAAYVGLVASTRRGRAVLDELGLDEAARGRVRTPAGLDIGARTAGEIAVSILAEVVRELRAAPAEEAPAHAVDPVCGMSVVPGADVPQLSVDGTVVWFCSSGCRDRYAG